MFFSSQTYVDLSYGYFSIVLLTILFIVFLLSRWVKAKDFFFNNFVPIWTVPFILISIYAILNSNWNKEFIITYQSLFEAIKQGWNPYLDNVIYHRLANGSIIYSTFNYFPGEIIPYYFAYVMFGTWNFGVMLLVNIVMNSLVVLIFLSKSHQMSKYSRICYSLLLLLTSLTHSASLVFFLLMISCFVLLLQQEDISLKYRFLLVILMGIGSLAKFFMLPFIFIYFWHYIFEKKYYFYFIDLAGTLAIFLICTIPFGISNVLNSVIFFNLNLSERAQVTTYYFNILSGLCYFTDTKALYGILVIILFFVSVLLSRKVPLLKRILYISLICLIIFPTPEDQFLGCIFGLLLLSKLKELLEITVTTNSTPKEISIQNDVL